jgi:Flp pilus assembly protein TadD
MGALVCSSDMNRTAHNPDTNKAEITRLCQTGRFREALTLCEPLCRAHPNDPELWFLQGAIHGGLLDFVSAEQCSRKALELAPRQPMLHQNLGIALLRQNRPAEAEAAFNTALTLQPGWPDALTELGNACLKQGKADEAEQNYEQALACAPGISAAVLGLSTLLVSRFEYDRAKLLLSKAAQLPAEGQYLLGVCHKELGELIQAENSYREALRLDERHTGALAGLAELRALSGDPEAGLALLDGALEHRPVPLSVALTFSYLAHHAGRLDEARNLLEESLTPHVDDRNRALVHFALGRLLDRTGDYEQAFEHFRLGNLLRGAQFNPDAWARNLSGLMGFFRREVIAPLPHATCDIAPIFIVGMPRSGTTLVEQIIASHPGAFGAGERPAINTFSESLTHRMRSRQPYPACLTELDVSTLDALADEYLGALPTAARYARCILDKMPGNYLHLGLIALIFPEARIIHCLRDPLDNCLSCYFQHFSAGHEYAYDLAHLGAYYRAHERLMKHWHTHLDLPILTLRYETLIDDQVGETRRLLDFCGLEWDEHCLRFHETRRSIATASFDQVRRPLNREGIGRWRHYQGHLAVLRQALDI